MDDPYPRAGERVEALIYTEPLYVRRDVYAKAPAAKWVVHRDYTVMLMVDGNCRPLVVPEGTITDFASVPRFFRSIVSQIGPHAEAAVVHDYLYVAWKCLNRGPNRVDRRFADRVFLAGMKAAGVCCCKRRMMYLAVRVYSGHLYRGRRRWSRRR